MQLKRISLLGFKSFVDRTVIEFGSGISGIVGPNGSGKSNIIDAIRWVMGEQSAKHLRGGAMEDVIFSGSQKRPALGMAEVFLTLDNGKKMAPAAFANCAEIEIGRRLYRSGESEYFINRDPCRLKDVHDFFLGTGVGTKAYSIVEQGTIGALISARPEDKRRFIEEAAGISKFKVRKEAAERRMESTRANLLRLNDIITELEKQVSSIERQARKAKKHEELRSELEKRELNLWSKRYLALSSKLAASNEAKEKQSQTSAAGLARQSTMETKIDSLRLEIVEQEQLLESLQRDLYSTQSQLKLDESETSHLRREKDELEGNSRLWEEELSELSERVKGLSQRIELTNEEKVKSDCDLAETNAHMQLAQQKLATLSEQESKALSELNAARTKHQRALEDRAVFAARIEEQKRRIAEDELDQQNFSEQRKEICHRVGQLEAEVADKKSRHMATSELAKHLMSEESEKAKELDALREDVTAAEQAILASIGLVHEKKSKIEALEELEKNKEGFSKGTRAILEKSRASADLSGVVGTVSDMLEVEAGFESAASAVLGDKLEFVIVESHRHGMRAIQMLKQMDEGRCAFIPFEVVPKDRPVFESKPETVVGHLGDYVKVAPQHEKLGRYLFGDAVVVKDMETAIDMWSARRGTYVTKDGELIDSHGIISGGSAAKEMMHLSQKRKLKELRDELIAAEAASKEKEFHLAALKERFTSVQASYEEIRAKSQSEQLRLLSDEKDMQRMESELGIARESLAKLDASIAAATKDAQDRKNEMLSISARLEELAANLVCEQEQLSSQEAAVQEIALSKSEADRGVAALQVRQVEASAKASQMALQADELASSKATAVLEQDRRKSLISFGKRRLVAIDEAQVRYRESIEAGIKAVAQFEEDMKQRRMNYETSSVEARTLDAEIKALRQENAKQVEILHRIDIEIEQIKASIMMISQKALESYHCSLGDVASMRQTPELSELNEEIEEKLIEDLKQKLDRLGGFDQEAIAEGEQLRIRLEFLLKQRTDLNESLESLSQAITRINKTSRERFEQTFNAVDQEFKKLFPLLFRGGQANIAIGEGDLLDAGVEIMAQPPGKRLQSMTLLSGGEKALTAVAFIFALFLVKPSPFCLLDEVDAPLDDVNIDRFNELVRSMISRSQFIIITHNKRTMEMADMLYGVTMPDPGVSKIVSAKMEGVEQ